MRVDPLYITSLVGALDQTQFTEQELTEELSSGVRFHSLSADPISSGQNVLLLNQIQQDDSFTQSSSLVTGQMQVADSALASVVSQLAQALSLAISANNGTMNGNNLKSIASQLTGILNEVEALANTSYQGQYVFAGGQTGSVPFSTSNATSPGVTSYNGDGNINYLHTPNGQKIQLNVRGDQIFDGAGANSVFQTLNNLIADYANGTINMAVATADTEALNTALNYVSEQRVMIDNAITQLGAAAEAVTNGKTQLMVAQTNLMQADIADVATRLSLTKTQQTALESVISQFGSGSLFDRLNG